MVAVFVGGLVLVGTVALIAAVLIGIGFFRATRPEDDSTDDRSKR